MKNLVEIEARVTRLEEQLRYQLTRAETAPMRVSAMRLMFDCLQCEAGLVLVELRRTASSRAGWELWYEWRGPLEEVRATAQRAVEKIDALGS